MTSIIDPTLEGDLTEALRNVRKALLRDALETAKNEISGLQAGTSPLVAEGSTAARGTASRFADRLTPLDFGAVGDGVTNDRAAFAAALDVVRALFIPVRDYLVSSPVSPGEHEDVTLLGDKESLVKGSGITGNNGDFLQLDNGLVTLKDLDFEGFNAAVRWLVSALPREIAAEIIGNRFSGMTRGAILDEENQPAGSDMDRFLVALNRFEDALGPFNIFVNRDRPFKHHQIIGNNFKNATQYSVNIDPTDQINSGWGVVALNVWDRVENPDPPVGASGYNSNILRTAGGKGIIANNVFKDLIPIPESATENTEAIRSSGEFSVITGNFFWNAGVIEGQIKLKAARDNFLHGNFHMVTEDYKTTVGNVTPLARGGSIHGVFVRQSATISNNIYRNFNSTVIDTDTTAGNAGHEASILNNRFFNCNTVTGYAGLGLIRWVGNHDRLIIKDNTVVGITPSSWEAPTPAVPTNFLELGSPVDLLIEGNTVTLVNDVINVSSDGDNQITLRNNHFKDVRRLFSVTSGTTPWGLIEIDGDIYETGPAYSITAFFGTTANYPKIERMTCDFTLITPDTTDSRIMHIPCPEGAIVTFSVTHEIAGTTRGPLIQETAGVVKNETGTAELLGTLDVDRLNQFSLGTATKGPVEFGSDFFLVRRPANAGERSSTKSRYKFTFSRGPVPV